jgi:lipid-A-disaccharide synthase
MTRIRRIFIIAGEASGDLHGSHLVAALKAQDPSLDIQAWGGDLMERAGARITKHYRDLAFMGFAEVLANLRTIMRNFRICRAEIQDFAPDAVIMIDYPGFNLRMAGFVHNLGIKVFYYISPQVWAWKKSRIKHIRRDTDKLFVILPFEKKFYDSIGFDVEYFGHPLTDHLQASEPADALKVALLPGSRRQEVQRMLPIMLEVAGRFPAYTFVIAATSVLGKAYYEQFTQGHAVDIVFDSTYNLLRQSRAALVTSGTATLEAALIGTPQLVCYKASPISYRIARALVKVKYISLVNLILDKAAVIELIQEDVSADSLSAELERLLNDSDYRASMFNNYADLRRMLGEKQVSAKIAARMLKLLESSH